jgi:hypothetical protein
MSRGLYKIMEKLHILLSDLRKKVKLSRKAIENLTGFRERTIGSYERGERAASSDYINFIQIYCEHDIENNRKLSTHKKIIEIYKFIYNQTDEDIMNILQIDKNTYNKYINITHSKIDMINFILLLSSSLKIKPSQFDLVIMGNDDIKFNGKVIMKMMIQDDVDINQIIKLENSLNHKELSVEYFLSVLKKRNSPTSIFIPNEKDLNIVDEYKQILSLLEFAPKEFIQKLIIKLEEFKNTQNNFFD